MTRFIASVCVLSSIIMGFTASDTRAEGRETAKIEIAGDVLKEISALPENAIPPALLSKASGIAIIPNVIKAGFILGGRHGNGILSVRDKDGTWSNPSFITITGGSIGWQIGVESIDIVLVFKNESTINHMLSGKFTIGADASIAAGPIGRTGSAATDIELKSEIYSYSRSRGLFAGLALDGAALLVDEEANVRAYGKEGITARDIFSDKDLKAPAGAERLRKLLTEYTVKEK